MNEQYEQLIADYLQGSLDEAGQRKLESLLESGEIDFIDFRAMEQLHQDLEMLPVPKPSAQMRSNFYDMLEAEVSKQQEAKVSKLTPFLGEMLKAITLPRLAYTFSLLVIGALIGSNFNSSDQQMQQLSSEMANMRQMMMVSMLEGPSTTDRLRAVNISASLPSADQTAIRALLFTLNNDASDNVRLQAVEALVRWGDQPEVRQGLVKSIARQQSDIVITELADAMVELGLKSAATEFQQLVQQRELNPSTKQKIDNTLAVLL